MKSPARGIGLASLLAALLLAPTSPASSAAVRHSPADCRTACQDQNIPASCAWLSPSPPRCTQAALRACESSHTPGPAQCLPPKDLPACGTNHGCPFGALCVNATCQVVGCGSHNGIADCTGTNTCQGDKCVVSECSAVTDNCPRAFHCEPAAPPFSDVSGTCVADVPGVGYCASDVDCIAPGDFNPTCMQGICTRQGRRLGRCQMDDDCRRWCRRGRTAMRMPRCDAASTCVCPSCTDDAQCGQLLPCPQGRVSACLPSGTCICRKQPQAGGTTTTSSTTSTTDTTPASTTSTTIDTTCCCTFEVGDSQWHCVHGAQPSGLCYVPWPDCCDQPYTVCE